MLLWRARIGWLDWAQSAEWRGQVVEHGPGRYTLCGSSGLHGARRRWAVMPGAGVVLAGLGRSRFVWRATPLFPPLARGDERGP